MKTIKFIFLTILSLIVLSCEKDDTTDNSKKTSLSVLAELKGKNGMSYSESLSKWSGLKDQNRNSYVYQITFTSWIGLGSTTELKVENGIVTSRIYESFQFNSSTGENDILDSYTETKNQLGTHEHGAKVLTIDALYLSCAGEYLIADSTTNSVYFETEANGLMTTCGYSPNGCADDCFNGISITAFKWIK